MTVLIIDDNNRRATKIRKALEGTKIICPETDLLQKVEFPTIDNLSKKVRDLAKKSVNELYFYVFRLLEEEKINLLFLDLSLKENVEKGKTTGEMLIEMLLSNVLHKKLPIIAYSRNIDHESKLNNPEKYLGKNVNYVPTDMDGGICEIRSAIFSKISSTKFHAIVSEYKKRNYKYNIAFLCALKKEYDAVVQFVELEKEDPKKFKIDNCGTNACHFGYIIDEEKGIILKVLAKYMKDNDTIFGEYGERKTNEVAGDIIENCTPEYIAMAGVMAGYKHKVKLGDVIIAKHSFIKMDERNGDGDFIISDSHRKYSDCFEKHICALKTVYHDDSILSLALDSFINDYKNSDIELNEAVNKLLGRKSDTVITSEDLRLFFQRSSDEKYDIRYRIHEGAILTRNRVLDNQKEFDKIVEKKESIIGLEMEIDALYRVAEKNDNTKAIAIKTVVDYADGAKNKAWHTVGSYLSAKLMYTLFLEIIYPEKMKKGIS